ncbi:MGDG synthase family glycosyltransferase [Aneurinibacillus terranovensis]|uniref:MGDG synthase family glycosyltransferase n=1 Tax=Aneurinibacillus terranovensis TaxID=278991 RepID=UPI0004016DF5|nr:glycosyltransferase [Aneurinibacillus terranovensis]
MQKNKRILILTENFGDGHSKVAQAISEAVGMRFPDGEPVVFEFLKEINPVAYKMIRFWFFLIVKKFPLLYGWLYNATGKVSDSSFFDLMIIKFIGVYKIQKMLTDIQPSVVVSTCPLAANIMSKLKEMGRIKIPIITVITDHTDHHYWISPYTDRYLVGSDYVRQSLLHIGIPDSKISVTGIPIRSEFNTVYNKHLLVRKYNLDPSLPVVLVMGGGDGIIGRELSQLIEFNSLTKKINLIIVCGHNETLRKKLVRESKYSKHHVLITGYVNCISEFMAISDLMITKPGGVTTSEAISSQLPMLLYKPIPGQEVDNANFLVRSGVAIQAYDGKDLIGLLQEILVKPAVLFYMKRNAKELKYQWDPEFLNAIFPREYANQARKTFQCL